MHRYLLLLRESPQAFADLSPAEYEALIREYMAWSQRLQQEGRFVSAEKLSDEGGRRVRRAGVSDGPYAESKDLIGGFYLVLAESYDDAVRLAQGCPHLRFGEIEVRAIDER